VTEPVLIGLANEGLSIQDVSRDPSGAVDRAFVRLTKTGLIAQTWVYAHERRGFDGLTAFFEKMNHDWRGWTGERRWSSLESDLNLVAKHDGHVRLEVVLVDAFNWTITAELTLAPGEELSSATEALGSLLT
jgi:hypothetical protein